MESPPLTRAQYQENAISMLTGASEKWTASNVRAKSAGQVGVLSELQRILAQRVVRPPGLDYKRLEIADKPTRTLVVCHEYEKSPQSVQ